jgi:hypothetical protein
MPYPNTGEQPGLFMRGMPSRSAVFGMQAVPRRARQSSTASSGRPTGSGAGRSQVETGV